MSSSVITNQDQFMDEVINKILPSCDNVSFLVGFFYFSWFQQIYKNLIDKKVRILIWMDVEKTIRDLKFKASDSTNASIKETLNNFKNLVNKTDLFEWSESIEAINIFINKIHDWSLEIRQTLEPDHSKMYLFHHSLPYSQWWLLPWTLITWSSNLSSSWLHNRKERNFIMRDQSTFNDSLEDFDYIRNNESIPLTQWWDNDKVINMLKNETWLKLSDPYVCYMRLLSEYFKETQNISYPSDITDGHFQDLEYQTDAIKKALHIIDEHSWVIIADVVWLGKSIIWSTILHNISQKAIIIAPPHLVPQREDYRKSFDFEAEIYSSWVISKAYEDDNESIHKAKVILIDEAHKYRNSDTIDYWYIHQLCQNKKVILLTATPFNNEPNDVFNLIKLFQIPNKPTLHTKNGLLVDFVEIQNKYIKLKKEQKENIDDYSDNQKLKSIANEIRQLISPIVVRRSRVDLDKIDAYKEDLEKQWYQFSKVEDPIELKFDLWDIENLYIDTLDRLTEIDDNNKMINFKWARYNPLSYLKNVKDYEIKIEKTLWYKYELLEWRQRNMPFFMRRLLVSRFESSIFAFRETLKSLIKSIDNSLEYIEKLKWMPVIKKWWLPDIDDLLDEADVFDYDDFSSIKINDILDKKQWFLIPISDLKDNFILEINQDKNFLEWLLNERESVDQDSKIDLLVWTLNEKLKENKNRKIVIFSQYTATIDYLYEKLWSKFRILKVTWKTKTEQLKNDIKFNFDAWIKLDKQKNEYDILLGTDAISEWYNLHRAWIIINYDIPYNPTRVIQRVGRINRINKKVFDNLYIFNYFPSLVWEKHTWTKRISTLKIKMIATILWIDVKTLTDSEEIWSFYKKELQKDVKNESEISWDVPYYNDFKNAKINNPNLINLINSVPERTKIQRTIDKNKKWIILFAKKWNNLIFEFYDTVLWQISQISIEDAFYLFKSDINEKPIDVSSDFYNIYDKLKDSIKKWPKLQVLNNKEKESLENVKKIFYIIKDPYFKLLEKVIEYRALPLYFMKNIRKINIENIEFEASIIKKEISESYLRKIIDAVNNYDEESQDLIIAQEFIFQN